MKKIKNMIAIDDWVTIHTSKKIRSFAKFVGWGYCILNHCKCNVELNPEFIEWCEKNGIFKLPASFKFEWMNKNAYPSEVTVVLDITQRDEFNNLFFDLRDYGLQPRGEQ